MTERFVKVAQLKSVAAFRDRIAELELDIPVDEEALSADSGSPLAEPLTLGPLTAGNRWCIHPMEGWDANSDGSPTEHTLRRWRNFGLSGAKFIWGGEAAAVQKDGRANPHQTLGMPENEAGLALLRETLFEEHHRHFGDTSDLVVGLQLTHSGRFCRPNTKRLEPRIAYHHPLLDQKFGIDPNDDDVVWTDDQLEELIESYVAAAKTASRAGYQFVDVKACHGYLLHEFLSARTRAGKYGGDFQGRTNLLLSIIQAIQASVPDLVIMVRLSIFDVPPFRTSREVGQPMDYETLLPYQFGFGTDPDDPLQMNLDEPIQLLKRLQEINVAAVNISCGSPYYNPHIQRPAIFPPSDGYRPPEDPLVGVARQIHCAKACKEAVPELPMVGTGYSYLQDYLTPVAQAIVRKGWIDSVGLGRMVLSYPDLPADTLAGRANQRKKICRTFSDCTTAPRNGIISGCYPLDPYYKEMPEAEELKAAKRRLE